jgi:hypothetical protein
MIQMRAQQVMSPNQIQDGLRHLNDARLSDMEQRSQQSAAYTNAMTQAQIKRDEGGLLHDMGATTTEQYRPTMQHGDKQHYTVKNTNKKMLQDFAAARTAAEKFYKRPWAGIEADLDALAELPADQRSHRAEKLGIALSDVDAWREHAVKMGVLEKSLAGELDEPDESVHKFSDYQERKADVIEATLDHGVDVTGTNSDQFEEDLQSDTRYGDIARAFVVEEEKALHEAISAE